MTKITRHINKGLVVYDKDGHQWIAVKASNVKHNAYRLSCYRCNPQSHSEYFALDSFVDEMKKIAPIRKWRPIFPKWWERL